MTNTGFLGLPSHVQQIVIEGLDAEVTATREHIKEAEQARPVDPALLGSLKSDIEHADALRNRLTSGQA